MKDIKDVLEFFKSGKISDQSMELEIARAISTILPVSVKIDDRTSISSTNSSYLAALVPERINGVAKTTFVLDKSMLVNKLTADESCQLIHLLEKQIHSSIKILNDFVLTHKDTEVSYLECVMLYLHIYLDFLLKNEDNSLVKRLMDEKTIDKACLDEVCMSINMGTEKQDKIVEFILVHKLLPEFALQKAEDLFKRINVPGISLECNDLDVDTNKTVDNYWYSKIVANITGSFNPETHTDLDPNYVPNSNLNK